ncbi:hypothetical protein PMZ80_008692 [Knufia obscura]|uniref:Uncharacterized protein n=1 Tax=Knufia obscura TaxID=1635080 RepID=A0ABR0RFJ3_9EURO|nr:hypothetical protein PMZ80_008692 [Knufia obscura]
MRVLKLQPLLYVSGLAGVLLASSGYCLPGEPLNAATVKREAFDLGPNSPQFSVQPNNPDFPEDQWPDILSRLEKAFTDAVKMAGVACVLFDSTEPFVYARYFETKLDWTWELPQSVICSIAGIYDPSAHTPEGIIAGDPIINPKYAKLSIVAGYSDLLPDDARGDTTGISATTFRQLSSGYDIPGKDDNDAITEVYIRAFDYPSNDQIRDVRTCRGLGEFDSGLMTSLGASAILHEMFHWEYMVRIEKNQVIFDDLVEPTIEDPDNDDKLEDRDYIDDYDTAHYSGKPFNEPPDGYGPANAAQLRGNGFGDAWQNADNYRWYVVSRYWQFVCTKLFGRQTDRSKDDKMIPPGSKGQVPYPGEELPPSEGTSSSRRQRRSAGL